MAKEFIEREAALEKVIEVKHHDPELSGVVLHRYIKEIDLKDIPAADVAPAVELEDLRAKYQALVAEKDKNSGDTAETYTTGYRYGHRNGQIELLQQILGIFDGGSYSSAACRLKYDDINDKEGTNELDKREG